VGVEVGGLSVLVERRGWNGTVICVVKRKLSTGDHGFPGEKTRVVKSSVDLGKAAAWLMGLMGNSYYGFLDFWLIGTKFFCVWLRKSNQNSSIKYYSYYPPVLKPLPPLPPSLIFI